MKIVILFLYNLNNKYRKRKSLISMFFAYFPHKWYNISINLKGAIMKNKDKAQDRINKNYEDLNKEIPFKKDQNFDILSIQKEMEIENIFLTNQNIEDLKNLNEGKINVEDLISKAFEEVKDLEDIKE